MTSSIVTRAWIFICLFVVGSITKDCFGYILGNDFLFGTFSLDKNENQSILVINPNVDTIAAINISVSYQGLRYEKQVILQNESLSLNDIMPMTSYRIISNQSIALQGVYGKFHSKYDILPILSLGSNYSLIYGMSFEFSTAVCSITANRNDTFISIKNPENRSIAYLNSPNRTFMSTFLLSELENIQIYSQNLYKVSFMSTELLSVVCGSKNSINNIRVHLPPLDRCVTSYEVPCFDKTTVPSGETHIRIIRLYPLLHDTINVFIDGVRDTKINQEKSIDYQFNVTADQPFCVRSHIRKWKNGNASFVDDNYHIISGHEIASEDCENISQDNDFLLEINKTVELCMCPCQAAPKWYNFTQEDVSLWLQEFKDNICKKLVLSKRDLTSYRRRRISVPDHRSSVTRLGVVGAIIICALIGAIISCDCPRFWRHALRLKRRYYLKHVKLYP